MSACEASAAALSVCVLSERVSASIFDSLSCIAFTGKAATAEALATWALKRSYSAKVDWYCAFFAAMSCCASAFTRLSF